MITGGSSGIGLEISRLFNEAGRAVYNLDKDKPGTEIEGVNFLRTDITNSREINKSLSKVSTPIDILINNAGVIKRGTLLETTEEEFDLLFDVNVKGSWLVIKSAKPYLSEKATVLQISSGHALHPETDPGIYSLTKQSTCNLAELLQKTCPEYSVKIAFPGPVETPLLLYGRDDKDKERIKKIAHKPSFVAQKIIELLESNKSRLVFDPKSWDYNLE